jgi:hypothetical protein
MSWTYQWMSFDAHSFQRRMWRKDRPINFDAQSIDDMWQTDRLMSFEAYRDARPATDRGVLMPGKVMISVRIRLRYRDWGAGQTNRWISTPGPLTIDLTDRPTDEFGHKQRNQSGTDRLIDKFRRPFDELCLWRTDPSMNFSARRSFDARGGND